MEQDRRVSNHNQRAVAAWKKDSDCERRLSTYLREGGDGPFILFDHRINPDSRADTDYIAVAPSGVYVIDAKNYAGKAQRKVDGFWRWRTEHLIVNGRDQTKLTAGMTRQTEAVRVALDHLDEFVDVPVASVLCLVGNDDWGMLAPTFRVNGVHVLWPRPLRKLLRREGPLTADHRAKLARLLSAQLPLSPEIGS